MRMGHCMDRLRNKRHKADCEYHRRDVSTWSTDWRSRDWKEGELVDQPFQRAVRRCEIAWKVFTSYLGPEFVGPVDGCYTQLGLKLADPKRLKCLEVLWKVARRSWENTRRLKPARKDSSWSLDIFRFPNWYPPCAFLEGNISHYWAQYSSLGKLFLIMFALYQLLSSTL